MLRKGLIAAFCLLLVLLASPALAQDDWKLLGDESDGSRAHFLHRIRLFYENEDDDRGARISPDDEILFPFSTRWTCGECHSYSVISKGWHFNAVDPNVVPSRPGQPWVYVDASVGMQVPLSYRLWPGTFKPEEFGLTAREFTRLFGRHMPGGGTGELKSRELDEIMREFVSGRLEINCLSCHDAEPAHDQVEYAVQTAKENFRWAAAATCSFATVKGSAKEVLDAGENYDPFMPGPLRDQKLVPPTVTYREEVFNQSDQVFFDIVREVPNHRCYFCHSNMDIDRKDAEKWLSDEDVHLAAGLKCVDCHRNGVDHNITRGYEREDSVSRNALAASSSCEGCHLGDKYSSLPVEGRLGAPVPEHRGIPPVHFDKLSCTACHSGPWPVDRTILTKTSRAHRLGTTVINKSHEVLPHIVSPVFAKQGGIGAAYAGLLVVMEGGKIAPHKLIWPAFWGTMEGEKVTPIGLDVVRQTVGKIIMRGKLSTTGDWPRLNWNDIDEALKLLAEAVEGEPVYVSGGKVYHFDEGKLAVVFEHDAAKPYLWPIAHNVRPATQALGVRRCEDCHATDAPFFFGEVAIDSPVDGEQDSTKKMIEFQGIDASYARVFAFSFVFRPWMKIICLGSCAVLAVVLLLYGLKALACVAKVLAEED